MREIVQLAVIIAIVITKGRFIAGASPAAKQNGKPIHARKFGYDVSVRPPVRTDWQEGTKWTVMGGVGESKTCSLRLYRRNVSQFT